jgi:Protein of unknown function (DUF3568)
MFPPDKWQAIVVASRMALNENGSDEKDSIPRGKIISMRIGTLLALLFPLVCIVGCLSPIALGTMETTGNETPVVLNHLGRGQDEGFFNAKYDDVTAATLRAAEALSLEVKEKKVAVNQASFRFFDAKDDVIDIFVVRRSDTMTSLKYDVGWFGSLAYGHLMFKQIISELHRSGSFPHGCKPKINNHD